MIKIEAPQRLDGWRGARRADGRQGLRAQPAVERGQPLASAGISLDLASDEGRRLFLRLVEDADVVVENFTPRVLGNLGLGYDVLRADEPADRRGLAVGVRPDRAVARLRRVRVPDRGGLRPRLAHRRAGRPAGPAGRSRSPTRWSAAMGALAIVAALERRDRTGEGDVIDLSQIEMLTTYHRRRARAGPGDRRATRTAAATTAPGCARTALYPCQPAGPAASPSPSATTTTGSACATAIDRPDLAADAALATVAGRERAAGTRRRRGRGVDGDRRRPAIEADCCRRPACRPPSPRAPSELAADEQLWARDFFRILERAEVGAHPFPGPIVGLHATPAVIERPAPLVRAAHRRGAARAARPRRRRDRRAARRRRHVDRAAGPGLEVVRWTTRRSSSCAPSGRAAYDDARPEAVAKVHERGRLTARERIDAVIDPGSFVETGVLAGAEDEAAGGLVAGLGTLYGTDDRHLVLRLHGVGRHADRHQPLEDRPHHGPGDPPPVPVRVLRRRRRRPGPGPAQRRVLRRRRWPTRSARSTGWRCCPGWVPTVAVVSGRSFAGNASIAGMSDVVFATRGSAIGIGGPPLVEAALGIAMTPEELAPSEMQEEIGGADLLIDTDAEGAELVRRYLAYFLVERTDGTPSPTHDTIRSIVPDNRRGVYDMRRVITRPRRRRQRVRAAPELGHGGDHRRSCGWAATPSPSSPTSRCRTSPAPSTATPPTSWPASSASPTPSTCRSCR